jgi:hypothetical protein
MTRDRFTAKKHHRYAIRYHFAPGCEAAVVTSDSGGCCVEARHSSGATLTISVIRQTEPGSEIAASVIPRVIQGWVSTCYAQCAPAPVAVFEAEGIGPQEFLTLIFPGPAAH